MTSLTTKKPMTIGTTEKAGANTEKDREETITITTTTTEAGTTTTETTTTTKSEPTSTEDVRTDLKETTRKTIVIIAEHLNTKLSKVY